MENLIGYARVSTVGQSLETQILSLKEYGCKKIFKEKISGVQANRPQLGRLLKSTQPGDRVIVTRIDRLARSTFDLFAIVGRLSANGIHFSSLAEPWTDTTSSTGRLMLAVLGGLADVERDLIRIRTAEGRARAIKNGIKMGRPQRFTALEQTTIFQKRATGATLQEIALDYKVAPSTIMRLLKHYKMEIPPHD